MFDIVTPAPLVQQVQAELPGLAALVRELKPLCHAAQDTCAAAHLASWRVMARVFAYAARPDVQAEVHRLNHDADGRCRGGRPKIAHRLVMDRLVMVGVFTRAGENPPQAHPGSHGTYNNWHTEWSRIAPAIGCAHLGDADGLARFEERAKTEPGGVTAAVEAVLEKARELAEIAAAHGPFEAPDLTALGRTIARTVARRLIDDEGHVRRLNRQAVEQVLRGLEMGFQECGLRSLADAVKVDGRTEIRGEVQEEEPGSECSAPSAESVPT